MLVFGCFHLFLGLLNVCELVVRKLRFTKCFFKDVVSASHGASSKHDAGIRCFSPKTITNKSTVRKLDEEAQLVARRVTNDEISRCNSGRGFLDEEQR